MTKKETQKLKSIFLRIGKESYVQLYERFKKECEIKIKLELEQSIDLSIEERIKKKNINNINIDQKKAFENVISLLKDEDYVFTKKDIEQLNIFTSRLNYLFIGTSPLRKGMADQVARVKDGTIWKNVALEIDVLFNNFKKAESWSEFQNTTKINRSFLDPDFKWILIYVFSDVKNCQNKIKYPLFYPAWQILADWCFDIPQLDYDAFCNYYAEIKGLEEPKQLYFNIYLYCLRLSLRSDKEYKEFLTSLDEAKKNKIMKEIRENEEEDKGEIIYQEEENNQNNRNIMGNSNSHFIIEINSLSNVFSILESGSEIKYKIITPSNTPIPLEIKSGDKILVVIKDKASVNFIVEETEPDGSLVLRKIFEVDRAAAFSFQEQGSFYPISKEEYESICSDLFKEHLGSIKNENETKKYVYEDVSLRNFALEVFKKMLNEFGEDFLVLNKNTDSTGTIKNITYRAIRFPKYFLNINMLSAFSKEQTKDDLTTGKSQRYSEENLKILGEDYIYLNFQWSRPQDSESADFYQLTQFVQDWSKNKYELICKGIDDSGKKKYVYYLLIKSLEKAINKIFYGAPGTGKSYKIDEILKTKSDKYWKRITFHPEYDNASFVGGYKPYSENVSLRDSAGIEVKDSSGKIIQKSEIFYKFSPQAFIELYKQAWADTANSYYLIIEEINRGNCAEIFGDIFQLLDRDDNGESSYSVEPSKELREYLEGKDGFNNKSHPGIAKKLRLPANFNIYATMNTSDQSLMPMDSAFKRRWDWEYIPIRYEKEYKDEAGKLIQNDSYDYKVNINGRMFSWIRFIETVNKKIEKNEDLGMDKCLGNYFIKADSKTKEISLKQFVNKVIFYLWNDVFKDEFDDSIFSIDSNNKFSFMDFFPDGKAIASIEKIIEDLTKYRETQLEKNDSIWLKGTAGNSNIPDEENIINIDGIADGTSTSDTSNNTGIPSGEIPENEQ